MLNHNHNQQVCAHAEMLAAYLYDEADAAEKIQFEAHLDKCSACRQELREFAAARAAIQEWRAADFDVLPTPVFEVPAPTMLLPNDKEKSAPWFDGWRRVFSFQPAFAMSSLVVLVAFFGIAALVLNFRTDAPIAVQIKEKDVPKPIDSPLVEMKTEASKSPAVAATPETIDARVKSPSSKTEPEKSATVRTATPKASTDGAKNNAPKAVQTDVKRNPKPNSAVEPNAPRLGETEDEDDDSIRLADLFDEVGVE